MFPTLFTIMHNMRERTCTTNLNYPQTNTFFTIPYPLTVPKHHKYTKKNIPSATLYPISLSTHPFYSISLCHFGTLKIPYQRLLKPVPPRGHQQHFTFFKSSPCPLLCSYIALSAFQQENSTGIMVTNFLLVFLFVLTAKKVVAEREGLFISIKEKTFWFIAKREAVK